MVESMYNKLNESGINSSNLSLTDSFWKSLWKLGVSKRTKFFSLEIFAKFFINQFQIIWDY